MAEAGRDRELATVQRGLVERQRAGRGVPPDLTHLLEEPVGKKKGAAAAAAAVAVAAESNMGLGGGQGAGAGVGVSMAGGLAAPRLWSEARRQQLDEVASIGRVCSRCPAAETARCCFARRTDLLVFWTPCLHCS